MGAAQPHLLMQISILPRKEATAPPCSGVRALKADISGSVKTRTPTCPWNTTQTNMAVGKERCPSLTKIGTSTGRQTRSSCLKTNSSFGRAMRDGLSRLFVKLLLLRMGHTTGHKSFEYPTVKVGLLLLQEHANHSVSGSSKNM